jgi:hypothetical protein
MDRHESEFSFLIRVYPCNPWLYLHQRSGLCDDQEAMGAVIFSPDLLRST